jgi:hypothetical protein
MPTRQTSSSSDPKILDVLTNLIEPETRGYPELEVTAIEWRGELLNDYETVVKLFSKTTTAKGLKVRCRLDREKCPTG